MSRPCFLQFSNAWYHYIPLEVRKSKNVDDQSENKAKAISAELLELNFGQI